MCTRRDSSRDGSVATFKLRVGSGAVRVSAWALCGQFEHFVDELILTPNISPAHPSNLSLSQHVDRFVTLNRSSRSPKFSESLLGIHSAFDGSVVLLDDVVRSEEHTS